MKKTITISLLTLILVALTILVSCKQQETIKIGVSMPATGPVAIFGTWSQRALELAKDEINSEGGINGKKLEIIYEDDKCQAGPATTNTKKLLEVNDANILIGVCSSATPGVAQAAKDKAIVFSPVAFSKSVIDQSYKNVFTPQPPIEKEMEVLADYIINNKGIKDIAIMYVNNDLGNSYFTWFKKAYEDLGGKLDTIEAFGLLDTDFRTQLTKIKASSPKGLMIAMSSTGLGLIVKQAKELGLDLPYFGTTISESTPFLKVGGEATEDFIYTYPLKLGTTETSKRFIEKYSAKFNEQPEMIGTNSYDIMLMLKQILKKCSTQDLGCMNTAARNIQGLNGASGFVSIQEDGMTYNKKIYIKTVKDGKFVVLE